MYLVNIGRNHWFATIPAIFMTAVCSTYIIVAPEGFKLSMSIGLPVGIAVAALALFIFMSAAKKVRAKAKTKTNTTL
jgi:ABC-type transport system involved in cytochrome c biogenesis permease subunit